MTQAFIPYRSHYFARNFRVKTALLSRAPNAWREGRYSQILLLSSGDLRCSSFAASPLWFQMTLDPSIGLLDSNLPTSTSYTPSLLRSNLL